MFAGLRSEIKLLFIFFLH